MPVIAAMPAKVPKISPLQNCGNRHTQLDSLRGSAALVVVGAHSYQAFVAPFWPVGVKVMGLLAQAAVMVFFVLSGYLIALSIKKNVAASHRFDVRRYAFSRFDRIYPPMIFALALTGLTWIVAPSLFPTGSRQFLHAGIRPGLQLDLQQLASTLLFANGFLTRNISANGPLWSLAFEAWFYVIAGLIAFRTRASLIAAIGTLAALGALDHLFAVYAFVWAAGATVALIDASQVSWQTTAASGLLTLVLAVVFVSTGGYDCIVVFNVCAGLTAACGLSRIISGQMRVPVGARSAAGFSYTLYLTHFPLLLLTFGVAQPITEGRIGAAIVAAIGFVGLAVAFARVFGPWVESIRPTRLLAVLGGQARHLQTQRA